MCAPQGAQGTSVTNAEKLYSAWMNTVDTAFLLRKAGAATDEQDSKMRYYNLSHQTQELAANIGDMLDYEIDVEKAVEANKLEQKKKIKRDMMRGRRARHRAQHQKLQDKRHKNKMRMRIVRTKFREAKARVAALKVKSRQLCIADGVVQKVYYLVDDAVDNHDLTRMLMRELSLFMKAVTDIYMMRIFTRMA